MARIAAAIVALVLAGCAGAPVTPEHPPLAEPLVPIASADRPVIAFVLGSGAARGFAHVGALKVLDAAGIRPDVVVGTSAGSLVGALYAGGIRGDALVDMALAVQRGQLVDLAFPRRGFIDGEKLESYVNQALQGRPIEQLELPFVAVATELRTGTLTAFNRGNTGMAVRASCSVPAVFHPTPIEGHEYVDGSLVSPVPVRVARSLGADLVIAIDVSMQPTERELGGTAAMVTQTFVVMASTIAKEETKLADVVVRPNLAGISVADLSARGRAIAAGEEAARAAIAEIRRLIEQKIAAKTQAAALSPGIAQR
jgi:NTE family protein